MYINLLKWKFFEKFIKDSANQLIYIHIGKCGGKSLLYSLKKSSKTKVYSNIYRVHISKPPILRYAHYAIVIRNPIQRAISAFNWRYKLVVEDEAQKDTFQGEHDVLLKYKNINSLSEALYFGDKLNTDVEKEFRTIQNLREDISFYLNDLLDSIDSHQLFFIFSTETLDEDIFNNLHIQNESRIHENSSLVSQDKKQLSELGYKNLKRFLSDDYRCIEMLLELNNSTAAKKDTLLN